MKQILRDFLCPQPKSKIKAGDGQLKGAYNFYTSSQIQSKFYHSATYTQPALIFGTGGTASVHYCNEPFSTSTDCLVMYGRHDAPLELIYYYLRSNMHLLQDGFKGAGLQHISKDYILNINIDMPAPSLQKQITHQMRLIDAMINGKKQQILSFDEAVKSRFIELFGDPDGNPMNWETAELERHLEIVGGFAFKSEGFTESGIPVLRIGNINSGHFLPVNMVFWPEDPSLARYKMYPGDLVMSLTGTVGKDDYGNVCVLSDEYPEYYLNQRNAKLAIGATLNRHYLSEMLKFSRIKKRLTGISRGVRQANISNRDILALRVPIPPIELQEQFATFVEQTDKSKYYSSLSFRYCQAAANTYRQEWMTCRTSDF